MERYQPEALESKKPDSQSNRPYDSATSRSVAASEQCSTPQSHSALAPERLLSLQRKYGNRYVQRVVALARKETGEAEVPAKVEAAIEQARGSGQALDTGVRRQMESALGADFSGVHVHADSEAGILNRALNARAFTTGQDVFFQEGEYNPASSRGRELLAHELTHVRQQSKGVRSKLAIGAANDPSEQEADAAAQAVMRNEQENGANDGAQLNYGRIVDLAVGDRSIRRQESRDQTGGGSIFQRQASGSQGPGNQTGGSPEAQDKPLKPEITILEAPTPTAPQQAGEQGAVAAKLSLAAAVQREGEGGGEGGSGKGGASLTDIVNAGKAFWKLMEDNTPSVDAKTSFAQAIPRGVEPDDCRGWSSPQTLRWQRNYPTPSGLNETTIKFRLSWVPTGNLDGKGNFIKNATCVIESADPGVGCNFSSTATIEGQLFRGSKDSPTASLQVTVADELKSTLYLLHYNNAVTFEIHGDGTFVQL